MTTPEESYRALVERYMRAGQLSAEDQEALEVDRANLGLLPATARSIEQAVAEITVPPAVTALPPNSEAPPVLIPVIPVVEPPEANVLMSKQTDSGPAEPRQRSADYLAHRQQYKQELWRAWKENGPLLSEEAFAHLRKLEEQFNLSFDDVAQIYGEVTQEIATGNPLPASVTLPEVDQADSEKAEVEVEAATTEVKETEAAAGVVVEQTSETKAPEAEEAVEQPVYDSKLVEPFERLEKNLASGKLRAADEITRDILFEIIKPKRDWIDVGTLQSFTPSPLDRGALKALDHLWHNGTPMGGFRRQLQVFGEVPQESLDSRQNDNRLLVLEFSREVGWWADGLEFFKLYDQLNFTTEAPKGHLPALWFWTMPRSESFKHGNFGLFQGRGGCRTEGYVLPAFMRLLKHCGIEAM
ncbi:MAG: GUN4 domain-containing protein [Elainella sp.]